VNYLEMIFEGQKHLMTKYHAREKANGSPVITSDMEGNLDDRQVQARIHELYGYLVRELSEALQELKNKPWKQTEQPTDRAAFVEEVGDSLHFFVELCITAGISAEDLHRAYFRMHQKNNSRLAGTY
jgi:NTP pyrophosphatase (non-canonical NTP hydrolase)